MVHYTRLETPVQIRGDLSATGRSMLMDWLFDEDARPESLWLGLATSMPADSSSMSEIVEVQPEYLVQPSFPSAADPEAKSTGYKRVAYPFANKPNLRSWYSGANGQYSNAREIRFPQIPVDGYWPNVAAWFVTTAPEKGELFAYGPTGDFNAVAGDSIVIPISGFGWRVPPLRVG